MSSLTGAIKEFTDILEKELFSEIVTQVENLVFEDSKRKNQYEAVRFAEKSLVTKNGKAKFERRYYKDNETGENVSLTDKILGMDKGERIDKKVKSELIQKASDQSYNKSGKLVVTDMDICTILIIIFSVFFLKSDEKIIFIMIGLMFIPNNLTGYFQQISQATQRFTEYTIRNVVKSVGNIIILVILFVMYKNNYQVTYIHYILLFILINYFLFGWYIFTYKDIVFGEYSKVNKKKKEIISFIKIGFPLMISNLCATLILTIDRQFVSILFPINDYAQYAFAYNLLALVTMGISAISIVLFPMLKQEKIEDLSEKYDKYISMIILLVGTMLILYFPLKMIINIIIPKYNESLIFFKIIFPSLISSSALTAIMHNYYKSIGENVLFFRKSIIILVISIIANIIAYFLSKSMIGFSVATIIVTLIWYIYTEQTLVKKMSVKWKKNLIYQILIMFIFYLLTGIVNNTLISMSLYIIIFILISYIFQKKNLKNILNKFIKKDI